MMVIRVFEHRSQRGKHMKLEGLPKSVEKSNVETADLKFKELSRYYHATSSVDFVPNLCFDGIRNILRRRMTK